MSAVKEAWAALDAFDKHGPDTGTTLLNRVADALRGLALQNAWDALTPTEQLKELRAGEASRYHRVFFEDPTIWGHCPAHGLTVINLIGYCNCGRPTHEAEELQ